MQWSQTTTHRPSTILLTPPKFTRKLPNTIEPVVHEVFFKAQHYKPFTKYLTCIPLARLVGQAGWLTLPGGAYALELAYKVPGLLKNDPGYTDPAPWKKVRKSGNYYSLLVYWARSGNYYHWIHDVLLRLYAVREHLPADVRFVVPPNLKPYQLETLRLLNINQDQLAPYTGNEVWEVEQLYFSPPNSHSSHDLAEADLWFRNLTWAAQGIVPTEPHRRIFISRRATKSRRITNEAEVEAFLQTKGFETVCLETLSFGEQVALFAAAKIVVSSHGAGLTNMLFANPGLAIVEIFEPQYLNHCYWSLSEALGHNYSYFLGQTVIGPQTRANIAVPMDKLAAALSAILPT